MRVTTPIADMDISIERLQVEKGALVMTNCAEDAMQTRTVIDPADMRKILAALLTPNVLWFAFTCLFRQGKAAAGQARAIQNHPTPNPW